MATFYEQRMLNLFKRYNLQENAMKLSKAYDDYLTKSKTEDDLGRFIRQSSGHRATLVDTMMKCGEAMGKYPKESKYCLTIMRSCQKMLDIADKKPAEDGFPGFLKLPLETRCHIYDYYTGIKDNVSVVPVRKLGACNCAPHMSEHMSDHVLSSAAVPMNMAIVCKVIGNEFLENFFKKKTVYFSCSCEMRCALESQSPLKYHISSVKFHWCGAESDKAILLLGTTAKIRNLIIVISKATTRFVSPKELELASFGLRRKVAKAGLVESQRQLGV